MPHHRLVEGLRSSVVQVRARVAEPPQRRPIRRTRPRRPGCQTRRAVPDLGWPLGRRQRRRDPPEQHNTAPGGGGTKMGRGARGRTGSSKGPRVRQADHPRFTWFVPGRCFVRVFRDLFILTAWRGGLGYGAAISGLASVEWAGASAAGSLAALRSSSSVTAVRVPTGSPSCPPRRACLLSVSCFPKQPEIEAGGFGNWIRLPGRHPKHECYSRV